MNPFKVVSRSFSVKISLIVSFIVLCGASITAIFFYLYSNQSLGVSYAQRLVSLSIYKYAVAKNSLIIYVLFGVAIFIAISAVSIYFSHKVAGPIYRLRVFAKEMSKGNFGMRIRFRSGDVIHSVAETADNFSANYSRIHSELIAEVDEIRRNTLALKQSIEEGNTKLAEEAREKIAQGSGQLKKMLSEIKV